MNIIYKWLIISLGVMLAAQIVPGIAISSFWSALIVAIVLGILNVLVGLPLKILTFPLSVLTFGLFMLVINAWVFWMASVVKGFSVTGFLPALGGSLVVMLFSYFAKKLVK
jgi:putative membrane protein